MIRQLVTLSLVFGVAAPGLEAQRRLADLGVQGTAALNLIWNRTALHSDGFRRSGTRFGGRVAARVARRSYAGLSVGSWLAEFELAPGGDPQPDQLTTVPTAVVWSAYLEQYPLRRWPLFLRAGVGLAHTRTYYPSSSQGFATLLAQHFTRVAPTIGTGVDVAIAPHLAITASLDYTRLLGVQGGRELRAGMLAGLGLTVH